MYRNFTTFYRVLSLIKFVRMLQVIVVTMAYRLGILGFYTDNTASASGNWGLLDQLAALDWVQRNIDSFGGSAQNVTVFGQGSGAVSVGLHVLSPRSRDKFQRAISMSGSALLRGAVANKGLNEAILNALADKFSCYRTTLTGCLRNHDPEALVKGGGPLSRWGPMVDGPVLTNDSTGREPFLPDTPAALMDEGRFAMVAHMIGYNRMENAFDESMDGGSMVGGITRDRFKTLVWNTVLDDDEYRRKQRMLRSSSEEEATDLQPDRGGEDDGNCMLNSEFVVDTVLMRYAWRMDDPETLRRNFVTMTANKVYGATSHRLAGYVSQYNVTYVYRYDYKLRTTKALPAATEWMDAPHGVELPMVWGMPYWPMASNLDWMSVDRRMSDTAMTLWTNFARYTDPAHRASWRWDEYQLRNPRFMVLDKVLNMSLVDQEPDFWNEYYPKVMAVSLHCCANNTVESVATSATVVHFWPLFSLPLIACFSPLVRGVGA